MTLLVRMCRIGVPVETSAISGEGETLGSLLGRAAENGSEDLRTFLQAGQFEIFVNGQRADSTTIVRPDQTIALIRPVRVATEEEMRVDEERRNQPRVCQTCGRSYTFAAQTECFLERLESESACESELCEGCSLPVETPA